MCHIFINLNDGSIVHSLFTLTLERSGANKDPNMFFEGITCSLCLQITLKPL